MDRGEKGTETNRRATEGIGVNENEMDDRDTYCPTARAQLVGAILLYELENCAEAASIKAVHLYEMVKEIEEQLAAKGEPFKTLEQLGMAPEQLTEMLLDAAQDKRDEQTK